MVAFLLGIALVSQLKELGVSLLRTYTGEKLVLGFRTRLFCHVQRLSLAYHDSKGSTDSTYRIQWDAQSIQYIMIDGVVPFVTSACTLALMLYVSVRLDPQLAMVGLAISPVLLVLMRIYRRRLRGQARAVKALDSSAQSVVQEVLAGLRVPALRAVEDHQQEIGEPAVAPGERRASVRSPRSPTGRQRAAECPAAGARHGRGGVPARVLRL